MAAMENKADRRTMDPAARGQMAVDTVLLLYLTALAATITLSVVPELRIACWAIVA